MRTFLCCRFTRLQRETSWLHAFFSLPLTFTLVAASISHFFTAAIKFSCFSSNKIRLFCFLISRSSSFSVMHVSVVVLNMTFDISLHVGGGRTDVRTDGHVSTKFFSYPWCSPAPASVIKLSELLFLADALPFRFEGLRVRIYHFDSPLENKSSGNELCRPKKVPVSGGMSVSVFC